ncbi:MAG: peptidyl-prolyl cis-trans isomerase [Planctomycetes bacterium]|nr:peptidyl-prolyl cis-trans isomerase [Planctomycetota bacterium]
MSDSIRASHILLMYAGSSRSSATRSQEEAQTQIQDLRDQIAGGADFATLAAEHSDCPSGQQGGDLGQFGRGQMVPEFEKAAYGLEIGGTSDVVETAFGYHLIQRTG